jgi:hypothetical protein
MLAAFGAIPCVVGVGVPIQFFMVVRSKERHPCSACRWVERQLDVVKDWTSGFALVARVSALQSSSGITPHIG